MVFVNNTSLRFTLNLDMVILWRESDSWNLWMLINIYLFEVHNSMDQITPGRCRFVDSPIFPDNFLEKSLNVIILPKNAILSLSCTLYFQFNEKGQSFELVIFYNYL